MKHLAALLMLALCACDSEVARRPIGQSYTETREQSCNYSGFCLHYDFFDGGGFKFGFSHFCSGDELVEVQVTPIEVIYESGKTIQTEDTRELRTIEKCN